MGQNHRNDLIAFRSESYLEAGSVCKRTSTGEEGYCLPAQHCLQVVREYIIYGTKIDICSFNKESSIICCPFKKKSISKIISKSVKGISAQKCEEYTNLATQKKPYFTLSANPRIGYTKSDCDSSIPLIVGGQKTSPGEFPHMAAIGWTRSTGKIQWSCGGSLISEYFIITAAHCTDIEGTPPDIIRLGEQNLEEINDGAEPQDIKIAKIIKHPDYISTLYYHDIGLIKLKFKPKFTKFIRPACLWQYPDLRNFTKLIATGWGRTEFFGKKSNDLQKVDLNLIEHDLCKKLYGELRKLPNSLNNQQFCAGYLSGEKDTCQGDSGGPINGILPGNKCVTYILGITSFGKFCAAPNSPGVYTKVYSYLNWIENIVFSNIK